ncbi:MAG: hypothetical protein NVS2B16_05470 [Chloroflexota bacterium]
MGGAAGTAYRRFALQKVYGEHEQIVEVHEVTLSLVTVIQADGFLKRGYLYTMACRFTLDGCPILDATDGGADAPGGGPATRVSQDIRHGGTGLCW